MNGIHTWFAALALLLVCLVTPGPAEPPDSPLKQTPKEQGLVHPEYEEKGFQNVLGITYEAVLKTEEQEKSRFAAWGERSQEYRAAEAREKAVQAAMNTLPPGTTPPREMRDRQAAATLGKEQARRLMLDAFHAFASAKDEAATARDRYRQQLEADTRQQQLQQKANQAEPVPDPLSPAGVKDWKQLRTLDELCVIFHLTRNEQAALETYQEFERNAAPGTNPLDSPQFRAVEVAAEQRKLVVDRVLRGTLSCPEGGLLEPRCRRCGLPLSLFNRACVGN